MERQARFDVFIHEFDAKQPYNALAMRSPAAAYSPSSRSYDGLSELSYPLHDRDVLVIACGRICLHRKKINISTVLAGQRVGIKQVDDGLTNPSSLDKGADGSKKQRRGSATEGLG